MGSFSVLLQAIFMSCSQRSGCKNVKIELHGSYLPIISANGAAGVSWIRYIKQAHGIPVMRGLSDSHSPVLFFFRKWRTVSW